MPTIWRENFRGKVDGLVARALERMRSDIETLRQRLEQVAKMAAERVSISTIRQNLQTGGQAPLNVQGLLGRLAQPQTGGAPALDGFPSTADPITQDGALFVLKGATNLLYRVKGDTEPETFELIGGDGTVTLINTGVGLVGGPITSTGTIALADTGVIPGSYTNANITVDAQGRLTAAADGGNDTTRLLQFEFDGRGSVIDPLTQPQAVLPLSPVSGTIVEVYIKDLDDTAGSSEFDVRAAPRGSGPPGAGQSLVGGGTAPSTIFASESTLSDLSDWDSDHIDLDDEVRVVVTSNATHVHVMLILTVEPD